MCRVDVKPYYTIPYCTVVWRFTCPRVPPPRIPQSMQAIQVIEAVQKFHPRGSVRPLESGVRVSASFHNEPSDKWTFIQLSMNPAIVFTWLRGKQQSLRPSPFLCVHKTNFWHQVAYLFNSDQMLLNVCKNIFISVYMFRKCLRHRCIVFWHYSPTIIAIGQRL